MSRIPSEAQPALAANARLQRGPSGPRLLSPEQAIELDEAAWAVLLQVDGCRTVGEIVAALAREFEAPAEDLRRDVEDLLFELRRGGLLKGFEAPAASKPESSAKGKPDLEPRPMALLAEVTYRCPLHCPYCSNPDRLSEIEPELTAQEWGRVFREAAAMGVAQTGISGGEPLTRKDLEEIIGAARQAGLYTNLLTSGLGLDAERLRRLRAAGLDAIQLSFQADEAALGDAIAGTRAHEAKLRAARVIRESGLELGMNVVLHRANLGKVREIIALAEHLGAQRLEMASTQYYGWALLNRSWLMPTSDQAVAARETVTAAQQRLAGKMDIAYVPPDYLESRPKRCMHGWGLRYLVIAPDGEALPCTGARVIGALRFESVRHRSLEWIWKESDSFNRFRGLEWMREPCRSCPQREADLGGCRCQAFALTGDAAAADPVCSLSPDHGRVEAAIAEAHLGEGHGPQMRQAPSVANGA